MSAATSGTTPTGVHSTTPPRMSRSLSSGAHSRDPLAHPGYGSLPLGRHSLSAHAGRFERSLLPQPNPARERVGVVAAPDLARQRVDLVGVSAAQQVARMSGATSGTTPTPPRMS